MDPSPNCIFVIIMVSEGTKLGCATCCMIMAGVAVPLLAYFGFLLSMESDLIELPEKNKPGASSGCFVAAALYAATFVAAFMYKKGKASA